MRFAKMHGLGNDFILLNGFAEPPPEPLSVLARRLCHRRLGVGADGLIVLSPSRGADFRFSIFNADGSQAEMCGNGMRCAALFAKSEGLATGFEYEAETLAGLIRTRITDAASGLVEVDMGVPVLAAEKIPALLPGNPPFALPLAAGGWEFRVTALSMGNPHCVVFVEDVESFPVEEFGPLLERHEVFPARANVEFVQVCSPEKIKMRVWERGVGVTLACGTGACAAAAAAFLNGHTGRRVEVCLPLGSLSLHWRESDGRMMMTGPAEKVFEGEF
ncbi:MAG: diaminopimelate epimerase [Clostridiales bacterium]|nr:diaminopimelate epimerase [Clostridiales bacterium]